MVKVKRRKARVREREENILELFEDVSRRYNIRLLGPVAPSLSCRFCSFGGLKSDRRRRFKIFGVASTMGTAIPMVKGSAIPMDRGTMIAVR